MTKQYLFTIKEGKLQQWKDWCAYLIEHKEEVLATMQYEHASRELFTLFSVGDVYYVVGHAEFFDTPVPADMTVPLNIEHRKNMSECLERVGSAEILYDIH
jgi:hypothetical protein